MTTQGMWCIYYCKVNEPTNWKVMKTERSDGVLVATKKRSEAYTFPRIKDAFAFAKRLIEEGKYNADVKKLSGLYFAE